MTRAQREIRRTARREKVAHFAQETGVYFAAVLGVFVSRYWGPYRSGEAFSVVFTWTEIAGAAVGGFIVQAYVLDRGGASVGKRARWKERMGQAFLSGFAIDSFLEGL
jgi:hypothetical protein